MDCAYYGPGPRLRRAAGEAWGYGGDRRGLLTAAAAALALVVVLVSGAGPLAGAVVVVAAALGARVLLWPVLVGVAWFRPLRRHWSAYVEDVGEAGALLFALTSRHDHQGQLREVRLRIELDGSAPTTAFLPAHNLGPERETYVQHPQMTTASGPLVDGARYRYVWSARRRADGAWTDLASGEHTASLAGGPA